jgi:hypothetical protein
LRAYPDQLRWAAVQDEDAELRPIAWALSRFATLTRRRSSDTS